MTAVHIVNAGYRSTNYWVLSTGQRRLLIDLGWPGMADTLVANLARLGVPVPEITHGFATHYHPDHAGAAEDLKSFGMRLIVTPEQTQAASALATLTKPRDRFTPITPNGNVLVPLADSRAFLAELGFWGELVHTPGHSDDSVSLVLDSGEAFTGDLTWPGLATEEAAATVAASWAVLAERGARRIYGGHGTIRPMPSEPR